MPREFDTLIFFCSEQSKDHMQTFYPLAPYLSHPLLCIFAVSKSDSARVNTALMKIKAFAVRAHYSAYTFCSWRTLAAFFCQTQSYLTKMSGK